MEKEELKSKVDEVLGSTKLTLSERTVSEELEDALVDIESDEQVDEKFVTRIANRLKRMNGNLHSDVGAENRKYKEQFEKDWNDKHPVKKVEENDNPGEPAWFKAYREKQEAELAALKDAQKEKDVKAKKESMLKSIKDGLKEKFESANVNVNSYILKNSISEFEITEDTDVDDAVKKVEKIYYKHLKAAGFEDAQPYSGNNFGGKKGKTAANDYFSRKAKKEGWQS